MIAPYLSSNLTAVCSECQSGAFHCKSGVCIPGHAARDGIRDCLGGDDEVPTAAVVTAETGEIHSLPLSAGALTAR